MRPQFELTIAVDGRATLCIRSTDDIRENVFGTEITDPKRGIALEALTADVMQVISLAYEAGIRDATAELKIRIYGLSLPTVPVYPNLKGGISCVDWRGTLLEPGAKPNTKRFKFK